MNMARHWYTMNAESSRNQFRYTVLIKRRKMHLRGVSSYSFCYNLQLNGKHSIQVSIHYGRKTSRNIIQVHSTTLTFIAATNRSQRLFVLSLSISGILTCLTQYLSGSVFCTCPPLIPLSERQNFKELANQNWNLSYQKATPQTPSCRAWATAIFVYLSCTSALHMFKAEQKPNQAKSGNRSVQHCVQL